MSTDGPAADDDPYAVLGVADTAPPEVIRGAWLALSKIYHPDNGSAPDPDAMRAVNAAHDLLSDPARRAELDAARSTGPTPPPPDAGWHDDPVTPTEHGTPGWGEPTPTASPPPAAPNPPGAAAPPPPPPTTVTGSGFPPPPPKGRFAAAGPTRTNTLSWVSLLLAVFCFPPLGFVLALVARSQIKRSGGRETGLVWANLAIAWFLIGVTVFVLAVVVGASFSTT